MAKLFGLSVVTKPAVECVPEGHPHYSRDSKSVLLPVILQIIYLMYWNTCGVGLCLSTR